ncbi:MAG: hypothetical protein JNJ77_01370 [Planctomycetia bacterium]|nr:hypothetical protein [Planctomycetia bacterium]
MKITLGLGTLMAVLCFSAGSLISQQPPAKKAAQPPANNKTAQPPGKTATAPEKNAPAKTETSRKTQPAASTSETIVTYTFDGVRIEGDYYPAPEGKEKTTPCLILLHPVGPKHFNASRADFDKLPAKLQQQGYAVAVIDFRGYGKSKTVESKFWNTHRPKTRVLDVIEAKDYATSLELFELMYDLTALKIWLNTKNNAKECNSHVVGIIGLEQAGLIAMAWAANEHTDNYRSRNRTMLNTGGGFNNPNFGNTGFGNQGFGNQGLGNQGNNPGGNIPRFEGEDIVCIVPISTSNRLSEPISLAVMERWITFLRERQVATMAMYGANDKESVAFWNKASSWVKPANDKYRYKNSGVKTFKTSLTGIKLLMNDTLDVPKALEDYLQESLKKTAESRLWSEQTGSDRPTPIDIQRLLR